MSNVINLFLFVALSSLASEIVDLQRPIGLAMTKNGKMVVACASSTKTDTPGHVKVFMIMNEIISIIKYEYLRFLVGMASTKGPLNRNTP